MTLDILNQLIEQFPQAKISLSQGKINIQGTIGNPNKPLETRAIYPNDIKVDVILNGKPSSIYLHVKRTRRQKAK